MKKKDPINDFLKEKGCPQSVVKGGILGLVKNWEQVVEEVGKGYALTLDDYLNDLDGRQILEEALKIASRAEGSKIRERVLPVRKAEIARGRRVDAVESAAGPGHEAVPLRAAEFHG